MEQSSEVHDAYPQGIGHSLLSHKKWRLMEKIIELEK